MDKKIASNLTVGIFVALGVAIFIFILFSIGDGASLFSGQFSLLAKYPDVKGLHQGSEVSLSGLRVGVVKNISVSADENKMLIVELSIQKKFRERIRNDSVASIRTQGMLGDKYIEISIGSPDAPALEPGAFISTQQTADLFTKGGNLVDDISKTFDKGGDFDTLIKNLNRVSQNLVVLTSEVQRQKGLLHELIYGESGVKFSRSMGHMEDILRKVNQGEGSLGALINDPTLYEDLKYMMGGAKRSSVLKYFMRSFIESGEQAEPKEKNKKSK